MDKNDDIITDGIDERIESFLRGTMNSEEEASFKKEICENPELRYRAKTMASLIKGIQRKEAEREKKAILSVENSNKSKVRPIIWWACSVAAVFAIFFGIYKGNRYRALDATVSPYYTDIDMNDISRGDVDSATVIHLYDLFAQIKETRNTSSIIKELEPIYRSLDNDFTYNAYANDIAWNLALAYVKNDQIDKAITILKQLKADNPDTPIFNKADELIKKLQDL